MQAAQAQLDLARNVGEGEGQIAKELAEYRINAGNAAAQAMIDAGIDEAAASRLAALAMAQNAEEFDRVAMEVCTDVNGNFNQAAYDLAQTMYNNLTNVKTDLASVATQAHETAKAIAGMADGAASGSTNVVGGSGGGTGSGGIKLNLTSGSFEGTEYTYTAKESGLEDFISQIELDISSYQDAISQIDGQIATLTALKNIPLKEFKGGLGSDSGKSGSGSGSAAKDVEEYIASIDDYRDALERLRKAQEATADVQRRIEHPSNVGQNLLSSYHHGGIAGDRGTLKQNEMLSLLEKGEAILDDKKQQALYRLIDFTTVLSDRFSKAIASTDLSRVVMQNSPNALNSEQLANITNGRDIQITFAGESSVMYGLMVYDIGGRGQDEVSFGNTASIVETRTNNRIRPIHFGVNYHEKPCNLSWYSVLTGHWTGTSWRTGPCG